MNVVIRPIERSDNPFIAKLIRSVFEEFKIDQPGTVYTDPTTDTMFEIFRNPQSAYWVAEANGKILGGCGVYPTDALPEGYAELVKFYLSSEARGVGTGRLLMEQTIKSARKLGYKKLYLESFPELSKAVGMYKKAGFIELDGPLGNSGHYACNIWMIKNL